jgi:hypothetical protein
VITKPDGKKMRYRMKYHSDWSQAQLSSLVVYDENEYPEEEGNFLAQHAIISS